MTETAALSFNRGIVGYQSGQGIGRRQHIMISENLVLPFRTKVLGREVSVTETVLGEDV